MMETMPSYVSILFGLLTLATVILFYRIMKKSDRERVRKKSAIILIGLLIWLTIQAILALSNVYSSNFSSMPPRIFVWGLLPTLIVIIALFITKGGRQFVDGLPLAPLTYLNTIRIFVELVLWLLYFYKTIPRLMTFEGRNFDILAGITAPLVAYYGISRGKLSRSMLILWNLICLGLLLNVVVNGLLSAPTPLQVFAPDQPNKAIFYFPFNWLPSFIVPLIFFGHFVCLRQLLKKPVFAAA
jgi:hypothetical protein